MAEANGKRVSVSEELLDAKLEALDERQKARFSRVYLVIGLTVLGGQGLAAAVSPGTTTAESVVNHLVSLL